MADGNGNQASFNNPQGIYFDSYSNNLIIADQGYYSIRKMNQSGFPFISFLNEAAENLPQYFINNKFTIKKKDI